MKAYKLREEGELVVGFVCSHCDDLFRSPSTDTSDLYVSGTAWYCSDSIDGGSYYRSVDEEDVWWCPEGCFHHDEGSAPVLEQIWACGDCGSEFADEDNAVDCCT